MVDPVSVLAIVDGSTSLVLKCASVIKSLHDIADKHKKATITIMSMAAEVDTIELAWSRVKEWAQDCPKDTASDMKLLQRLDRSLECGALVLSALQTDLSEYNKSESTLSFRQRSKAVWNEAALKDHQDRIRGQAAAMALLLQALQLPTRDARQKLLHESRHTLRDSDESAYSIVPSWRSSRGSVSTHSAGSRISIETNDLIYRRLSCEEDLFAARVYKRKYGNPLIHSVFRNNFRSTSEWGEHESSASLDARRSRIDLNESEELSRQGSLRSPTLPRNELTPSKPFEIFRQALKVMPLSEKQAIQFDSLPASWQEFPRRDDLRGKIGNDEDPGDGLVYADREVAEARAMLHGFYDTWVESIAQNHPMELAAFAKAGKLTNMANICLILRGMEQERLFDAFWQSGTTDTSLPLSVVELQRILKDDDLQNASIFAAEQYRIVRRDWRDGDHLTLLDKEPLPLILETTLVLGSLGLVERVKDSFTNAVYMRKEIKSPKTLSRQVAHLKKVRHMHVLQIMKTYQRGDHFCILLQPEASTDIETILSHHFVRGNEYRARFYRIILTAFGCLSRGLAQMHGMNVAYPHMRLNTILYKAASSTVASSRFMWLDSRYVTIMNHSIENNSQSPRRFDAPESLGSQPTNSNNERSMDIFSFGCVLLEITSRLLDESGDLSRRQDDPFWSFVLCGVHVKEIHAWIERKLEGLKEGYKDLDVILRLGKKMTRTDPQQRPSIEEVVEELTAAGSQYFCKECPRHPDDSTINSNEAQAQEACSLIPTTL